MDVSEAVERRISVRAFRPDPVPLSLVQGIVERAARSPSGGNLQPWRVYALAGEPLDRLKQAAVKRLADGADEPEYDVYPPELWEPFRTRRYQCGEDLYATIGIPREDKPARLRQMARNAELFGAPVGLFFYLDRKLGPPQWSDLGMYMQTVMLLAEERGLSTCAQEFWARLHEVAEAILSPPKDHMLFAGMALGWGDADQPINRLRTRREPLEAFARFDGF